MGFKSSRPEQERTLKTKSIVLRRLIDAGRRSTGYPGSVQMPPGVLANKTRGWRRLTVHRHRNWLRQASPRKKSGLPILSCHCQNHWAHSHWITTNCFVSNIGWWFPLFSGSLYIAYWGRSVVGLGSEHQCNRHVSTGHHGLSLFFIGTRFRLGEQAMGSTGFYC